MLYYVIDGFNVIHKIPKLVRSQNPHTALINFIKTNKLTGSIRNKVVIVFDGSIDNDAVKEKEFSIRFSLEKSADDMIKAIIRTATNKKQIAIVSDDREIKDYAKHAGADTVSVKDFIQEKHKPGLIAENRDLPYAAQREITEELKKIWLKE